MQEKTLVLEMVKNGIISVDEAVKLLEALNNSKLSVKEELEQNLQKFSKSIDSFAKDIKNKFEGLTKNDGEKLKENTKNFFNKTGEALDNFTNSVKDLFNPNNEFYTNENNEQTENKDEIID